MKHGKEPTVKQAKLLTSRKLDYTKWLVISDTHLQMVIVNRESGNIRTIFK